MIFDKKLDKEDTLLEELGVERLKRIRWQVENLIKQKEVSPVVKKATGGQARIMKLQLKAFQRIPSEIIAGYMTEDERREYEILIDAYNGL